MNKETPNSQNEKSHNRTGRSPMLTLIYKNQKRQSFAYSYLLEAAFDEEEKADWITLNFGFTSVRLGGRKLDTIFRDIVDHHAAELHEIEPADLVPNRGGILKINIYRPEEKP